MTLNRLRQIRISQGKSMTFMARKLGYKSTSGYDNIEKGRVKLSLENAKIIAEILDCNLEELFFEEELHDSSNGNEVI